MGAEQGRAASVPTRHVRRKGQGAPSRTCTGTRAHVCVHVRVCICVHSWSPLWVSWEATSKRTLVCTGLSVNTHASLRVHA